MTSLREHIIETAALGRPLKLGMLYDCRNDSIVPGITLWDQQQLQHNKDVSPQHNTEFTVVNSDTIEEKSKQLKVDGELKLSLLSGNVSVSGAARYFNDTKKSFIQQRLTLHYKTTTRFEHLTMEHLAQGQINHHELFNHDMATHVVVAVLYGADANFVFDKEKNLSDETNNVQGDVKIAADMLQTKFLCSAGAQVELKRDEHEKDAVEQMKCTFYGDFKLSSNPTTFEAAVKIYNDLPKMLGENGEHAVPVKVWLYPLDKLDSRAAKLQRNISTDLIRAVESVIEDLNVTSMRCGDLMEDKVAKTFVTFHNLVQDFQKFCTEYKQDFMINLRSILPEIRGGKTDIKDLSELLESHEKSPFRSRYVLQWITMKEEKSDQIKELLKQLKVSDEGEVGTDRNKYLLDLNVENLVSYTFTCLQHPEPLLTQQEIYLKPSTVKNPSENTLSLDFQEKSWTLEELMCMKNNLKIFKDLIKSNKSNKNTRFIVESVPQTPDKPGSCVLIYENGGSEVTCFVPPSKPKPPTVEYVTDNSIKLKMSSLCAATLRMQLLHKMEQENSWKSQTVTDESVTLTNLNAGTDYEIKCAAVGKIDYKVESDVTVTTTTGSVIKGHGAKSHQVPDNQTMKYFTVTLGCTLRHLGNIEQKFQEIIPALQNVQNPEDCDFIMAFCPVVAIKAAEKTLNNLPGYKPAVLVVLHHTSDPEIIVPNSSRSVNRENTITVDCVIHEDQGLLPCPENDKALSKVIEFFEEMQGGTQSKSPYHQPSGNQILKRTRLTYFTIMTGNTLGHHVDIERKLQELIPGLQMVMKLEESDLVLVFCPVVTRAGTDTEAAVELLNTQAGDKPAVLVVLHHTFNPELIVPDSSRSVNRQNTITVDCLFHEVQGFLMCYKNNEALSKVVNWIEERTTRKSKNNQPSFIQTLKPPRLTYFTIMSGKTLGHHVDIERKLQKLIPGLQMVMKLEESDLVLVFCPVVSRAGTDTEAAVEMLNTQAGNKPAVLVVLHHTRYPELIVPDSSRSVNRQNTITVDCLFYEDQGLLTCHKNNEALSKVVNWIEERTTRKSKNNQPSFIQTLKRPRLTYFTLMTAKTLGHHVDIEKKLQELIPGLQMVMKLEESDFILIFCPVVTQAGTDIVEALKMLNTQAGDKRAVLVVLHHTFNPEHFVPDSSRLVNRENTITVDCLFYEDQGLLKCHKNNEALSKVVNWLHPKGDENPEKNNILDIFGMKWHNWRP